LNALSSKKELCFEGKVALGDVIAYLEQLTASLKDGRVVVEKGREFLVLEPTEVVKLEVEAEQKKDEEKLAIELEWYRGLVPGESPDLKISSIEPAPSPEDGESGAEGAKEEEAEEA
jgi:amphi-Trp domain-containing protein